MSPQPTPQGRAGFPQEGAGVGAPQALQGEAGVGAPHPQGGAGVEAPQATQGGVGAGAGVVGAGVVGSVVLTPRGVVGIAPLMMGVCMRWA